MDKKLEEQLYIDFPKIFRQKDLSMQETLMCWGVETGDGWHWLIDNLCHSIQSYCDSRNDGVRIRKESRLNESRLKRFLWKAKVWFANFVIKCMQLVNINMVVAWPNFDEEEWQVEAVQVKQKFGTLRYYIDGGDDHIYGMIQLAEVMSSRICEMCGVTENITPTEGWINYLCPKCKKEREKELVN